MAAERQVAVARERAYTLLGRLVRYGLSPELEPAARAALGDLSVQPGEHYQLFGLDAPPYESFFLSPDRLLGGDHAEAVARDYAAGGFQPEVSDVAADHLGVQLAFLGWLEGARGDALRDDIAHQELLDLQARFLDQHLLRWLPAYVASVPGNGFYPRALRLALDLALDHREALPGATAPFELPEAPPVGNEGLRDIAELLCTPCHAGGLLTRGALRQLGDLPRGFGQRPHELKTLLLSAARFGELPAVIEALDGELLRWDAALQGPVAPWRARIAHTRSLLDGMQLAVAALHDVGREPAP